MNLYPFSATKRVQDFRIGGLTIREKWERLLQLPSFDLGGKSVLPKNGVEKDLKEIQPFQSLLLRGDLLPRKHLLELISSLKPGDAIVSAENEVLARLISSDSFQENGTLKPPTLGIEYKDALMADYFYNLHLLNREAILFDFDLITNGRISAPMDSTIGTTGAENIFIEEGAVVTHSFLNATDGPIYIGKNALVMEGCCIRGPVFIGEKAVLKMGAKIYGATTIGPGCTVGGEIKNCLFFANSNKAHEGYLGDSVVGEWCNFGAGSSGSNMKNNIGTIHFSFRNYEFVTPLKKCGLVMGDFSRTAINTAINTGTVIGVSAHVFGNGLTPKFIDDFSWGYDKMDDGALNVQVPKYRLDKALQDANEWKQIKKGVLTEGEIKILTDLFNHKIINNN